MAGKMTCIYHKSEAQNDVTDKSAHLGRIMPIEDQFSGKAQFSKEKLAALSYAEEHGNRAAGREFNVNEACTRQWRKQKESLMKQSKTRRANRGRNAQFPAVERELLKLVNDRHSQGIAVSTVELHLESKKISMSVGTIACFKASQNWIYGFLRRNQLSIRRRTHISQKLPEDFEEKIVGFQRFIIKKRKENEYDLSQLGNADQTPLNFDLPATTTVAPTSSKTVSIATTGNEKNRFTVMLSCTANGGKLPPYVIFKRKTLPKGVKWPKGIIVRTQEKGWMDQNLVLDWVKTVWQRRPGSLGKKSLLVLDAFRAHKSPEVKSLLNEGRTDIAVIPGGMTTILQPLDVSINKPMKVLLQRKWNDWYLNGQHTFTAGWKMRKPELDEICQWIVDAWDELDPSIIVRAFKKCCISNNMDGTEDDILWEDNIREKETTSSIEEEHLDDQYYTDAPTTGMTDDEIRRFFDSDEDDSDFEGF